MNTTTEQIDAGFPRCYRCFRPVKACLCKHITPIDTGIKFVFLMHPKEAYRQRTGTGRLANISLIDSEIIVGIDFTDNARLNELIGGTGAGAVSLERVSEEVRASAPAAAPELPAVPAALALALPAPPAGAAPGAPGALGSLSTLT